MLYPLVDAGDVVSKQNLSAIDMKQKNITNVSQGLKATNRKKNWQNILYLLLYDYTGLLGK